MKQIKMIASEFFIYLRECDKRHAQREEDDKSSFKISELPLRDSLYAWIRHDGGGVIHEFANDYSIFLRVVIAIIADPRGQEILNRSNHSTDIDEWIHAAGKGEKTELLQGLDADFITYESWQALTNATERKLAKIIQG